MTELFTKHEWKIVDCNIKTAINAGDKHIAMVNYGMGITTGEHFANARLIEAAPKMHDTLVKIGKRLCAGDCDEWTLKALMSLANEAVRGIEKE